MLWNAGQRRLSRERQARLVEGFTVARDAAMDVLVSSGQAKSVGPWKKPAYIRAERSAAVQAVRSPATRDAKLAELAALIPGMVRAN